MGVEEGIGRIAVREPRTKDRIDMVLDLIAVRGLTPPAADELKELRLILDDAEDFRNLCAHGAWSYSRRHQHWFVQVARGSWENRPKEDRAKRSKKINPEGQIIKPDAFPQYVENFDGIISILQELHANLEEQLAASPQKHP